MWYSVTIQRKRQRQRFRFHKSPKVLTDRRDSDSSRLLKGMLPVCCSADLCVKRETKNYSLQTNSVILATRIHFGQYNISSQSEKK